MELSPLINSSANSIAGTAPDVSNPSLEVSREYLSCTACEQLQTRKKKGPLQQSSSQPLCCFPNMISTELARFYLYTVNFLPVLYTAVGIDFLFAKEEVLSIHMQLFMEFIAIVYSYIDSNCIPESCQSSYSSACAWVFPTHAVCYVDT